MQGLDTPKLQLRSTAIFSLSCVDMHIVDNFNTIMHACLDLFVACSSFFVLPCLLLRVLGLPT